MYACTYLSNAASAFILFIQADMKVWHDSLGISFSRHVTEKNAALSKKVLQKGIKVSLVAYENGFRTDIRLQFLVEYTFERKIRLTLGRIKSEY